MIVDLQKERLEGPVRRRTCVVGTGIGAGSFIARYARNRGDLVVIEAGGLQKSDIVSSEIVGRPFGLTTTREISLGGTGNVWRGLASPMDIVDYLERPWMSESGWPIRPGHLLPYYHEVGRLLGLPEFSYFRPHRDHPEIEGMERSIDFDGCVLSNKYFLCTRPPKNFRRDILDHFAQGDDLLLLHAVAVEVVVRAEGAFIDKIVAKDPRGESVEVRADRFVLGAGALETPRLLLNSRRRDGTAVGNDHDTVGRYLMDHPMGSLSQIRLGRITNAPLYHAYHLDRRRHVRSGLLATAETQQRLGLPNHCVFLWPSFRRGIDDRFERVRRSLVTARSERLGARDMLTLLSNPNSLYRVLSYVLPIGAYYRYADLFFVTEQIPNRSSSVSLSERKDRFGYPIAKIAWVLTDEDIDSIVAFNDLALKALAEHAGMVSYQKDRDQIGESLTSAAHHSGTARMSANEREGVVDRNLKVWNIENLYICDASVLPTSGNANPALTVCALAIRLADRLVESERIGRGHG